MPRFMTYFVIAASIDKVLDLLGKLKNPPNGD